MNYPNITQYKAAIQDSDSFDTLNDDIQAVMQGYEPVFASGNFAVVFKMTKGQRQYALKCFLKDIERRNEKQQAIVAYIAENPSPYFVDYHYLEDELWVDIEGGQEYPVTWMEWIEAPTLGEKIKQYCEADNKIGLKELADSFKQLALWLLEQPFAHGDLKHDNILVKDDGGLVLVDYDGMFVPTLSGQTTNELGGKSYQHPKRNANDFNQHLDDFSILIIYTSLLALSHKPELYATYNNGQNIIFQMGHFVSFKNKDLVQELKQIADLKDFLQNIQSSLKADTINIANIKALIENSISKADYANELQKAKQLIESNYQLLENYNTAHADRAIIADTLKTQKQINTSIFKKLEEQLKKLQTKEENPLTEEWWNGLSETWKDIFLWNIQYWRDKTVDFDYFELTGNFSGIYKLNHQKLKELEISNILSNITQLKSFYIDEPNNQKIKSLTHLTVLTNLTVLYIPDNKQDLNPISELTQLTKLSLYRNTQDLGPIAKLTQLTILLLNYNKKDIKPIAKLTELKELSLWSNYQELSPIANLINLTRLNLPSNTQDLSPITKLTQLTYLALGRNTQVLSPISRLTQLSELNLWDNHQDLSPISNLINLTKLNLDYNTQDLTPIGKLTQLSELKLASNNQDLNPIARLSQLSVLDLRHNKRNLNPIANLTELKELNLIANTHDLTPIANLTQLNTLCLDGNQQNLRPIAYLTNLTRLDLYKNTQDLTPIAKLDSLKELHLGNNQQNLSPIANLTQLTILSLFGNKQNLKPIDGLIKIIKDNKGDVTI